MNAKEGVDERRKRKGEEGRQKVRKRQKRCRQVCDLFKELEGNRRAGGPQRGGGEVGREGGREVAVVAMRMTRNVSLPLAILMG